MRFVVMSVAAAAACAIMGGATANAASIQDQAANYSVQVFEGSSAAEKTRILNELSRDSAAVPVGQLRELFVKSLGDADAAVRERALWALAMRAGAQPPSPQVWRQERSAYLLVRPAVLQLLGDSEHRVRLAAVAAVGAVETDLAAPRDAARSLSLETATAVALRFEREEFDGTRAQLLNIFGSYKVPVSFEARRRALLGAALRDQAAPVVQTAVMVVWKLRDAQFLPTVVKLLGHTSANVRVVVGQAISSFGESARPYIGDLQRALAGETDELAKKAFEGALKKLGA